MRPQPSIVVGTGVDVVPISRVARLVRDHAGRLDRIFTDRERAYCEAGSGARREARYAAVFAAKEAVMKALGTGWRSDVEFSDIETHGLNAHGEIVLTGGTRRAAAGRGVGRILVSLASTGTSGMASVVAIADGARG